MSNRCSPGDRVVLKIKDGEFVSAYDNDKKCNEIIFDIISTFEEGYLVYVPSSFYLKAQFTLSESQCKKYNVEKKFVGSIVHQITDFKICRVFSKIDGMCCARCKDFTPMATANQPNKTFICYPCRFDPYR